VSAVFERVAAIGVVAILRAASPETATATGIKLIDGGLDVIEVSYNTPDAPAAIAALVRERPDALVGAGTVLTVIEAHSAADAGARFLLSPAYGEEVHEVADELGLPYIPGVFTAADVWRCLKTGLEVLKIFPASPLGPSGMQALLEPFPQVRSLPTGGVSMKNAPEWLAAGAFGLGMGGSLSKATDPTAAAREMRKIVVAARERS
jgi:2-dehydro-3-deoxyphosphogluconate aldolase/(4S)-4-hydroxy-2-oxoglutarate aldolase